MSERKNIPENSKACEELMNGGFFILVSNGEYGTDRILPRYYLRQKIEVPETNKLRPRKKG